MCDCVGMAQPVPRTSGSQPPGARPRLTTQHLATLQAEHDTTAPDLPRYDRGALTGGITHIGIGGFHRAHLAVYLDDLLRAGAGTWSVTGSGVMPHDERIAAVLGEQQGLYVLAEREGETTNSRIIGSINRFVPAHADPAPLLRYLAEPSTHIVSLTVTEGGYPVEHGSFVETPGLGDDCARAAPRSTFGILAAALDERRTGGLPPFTVLSCDNLPGNGDVARTAVLGAAALRSSDLLRWVDANGAFPNAMVDRITPATTDTDRAWVESAFGFVDEWPVVCEPFRQWALEDRFCDGRPSFEQAGVIMTSDVTPYEQMKLRLLNASHSGLAYHAALAGITHVHDAMFDHRIATFVRALMKNEAAPNLEAPSGIDLHQYQETLVQRFSNPAIADTIARLCLDGTAKFPTFIVPSLEAQIANGGPIRMLGLVLAGWCRYLRGVADDGTPLSLSHDPFLDEATAIARRSISDPRAFLKYERALGPNIGESSRLLDTFTEALSSLDRIGSLATLDVWTSAGAHEVARPGSQ